MIDLYAAKASLDELHDLLDCINSDMSLSETDEWLEFDENNSGTLACTLYDFMQHHKKILKQRDDAMWLLGKIHANAAESPEWIRREIEEMEVKCVH